MPGKRIKFAICRVCDEPFEVLRGNRRGEYCGHECRWEQLRRLSRARAVQRLRSFTVVGDGCWEHRRWQTEAGYGRVWIGGRSVHAHRFSWEVANGPIPAGMSVLHRCDNAPCVRPDHLYLGTAKDNALDRVARGRQRGNVKIGPADREDIRARHAAGASKAALAREYGVCKPTITRALGH